MGTERTLYWLAATIGSQVLLLAQTACLEGTVRLSTDGPATNPDNLSPAAVCLVTPAHGIAPLTVTLDGSHSSDSDGTIVGYAWTDRDNKPVAGTAPGKVLNTPGCYLFRLTVTDDSGGTSTCEQEVVVTATASGAPQVTFDPELPLTKAVLPRDRDTNLGEISVRGTVASPGYYAIAARLLNSMGAEVANGQDTLCADSMAFAFQINIPAKRENHILKVVLSGATGDTEIASIEELVAGDVLVIEGQSNSVAGMSVGSANANQDPYLRSFGTLALSEATTLADMQWHIAEGDGWGGPGGIGQWGLRMGRLLLDQHEIPLAVIGGGEGGKAISFFQRNDVDPTDITTNYGRLLTRMRVAGLDQHVRAILFYQGESDGSYASGHKAGWTALHADWLEDYPSVERFYVTQVRVGCGVPSPELREVQREFPDEIANVSVMTTHGLDAHDGCHYAFANGYEKLGTWYADLLSRDLYGTDTSSEVAPPNPVRAYFSSVDGREITIETRDDTATLSWTAGAEATFVVEGTGVIVQSGKTAGSKIVLTLNGDGRSATGLSYVGFSGAGPWITNGRGLGLLAFYLLPIAAGP